MSLVEYKEGITSPLRQATLCFLVKDDQVLLAMKKRGFGEGKLNGVGGKSEDGELIEDTAKRETREEIGVTPISLKKMATLDFYFFSNSDWNQQVLVYIVDDWDGDPIETEEMAPKWFKVDEIPYGSMWVDDVHWLPRVLRGEVLSAEFLFGKKEGELLDHSVKIDL